LNETNEMSVFVFDSYRLDLAQRELSWDRGPLHLEPKAFRGASCKLWFSREEARMSTDPTQTKPATEENAAADQDELKDEQLEEVTGGTTQTTSNIIKTTDDAKLGAVRNIRG
jgi:hypothetical protein